jgi:hypothetical protein
MSEFTPLREAVDTLASNRPSPDFGELKRRATHRGRRRLVMVAAATAAVIAGSVLAISGLDDDRRTGPVVQPKPVVGAVPVWYDAKGLHRGDVVEQTPVEIGVLDGMDTVNLKGALALVRSGAVYLDPATGDVWFHPWGGDPRIVGHNSAAGPGGDPNGDTAVWFEGSDPLNDTPGELVVYDTAAGREISRTMQSHGVTNSRGDNYPPGNGFLEVSAERVVWETATGFRTYRHDVRTQSTSEVKTPKERFLVDVHGDVEVFGERGSWNLVLRGLGRAEEPYPELHFHARLSPSGNHVLTVEDTKERDGAVIVNTRTGKLWRVPKNVFPLIAWSYGDIAMVDHIEDGRRIGVPLACDAARRACERLPAEGAILMPTN